MDMVKFALMAKYIMHTGFCASGNMDRLHLIAIILVILAEMATRAAAIGDI